MRIYLILSVRQAVLVKRCWDIFWHKNTSLLKILLRSTLLGTEKRGHPIARCCLHILKSALISCCEWGALRGKVYLFCPGSRCVEIKGHRVLNRKLVIKVDCLYLLGNHLDLILVATFTTNRKPFLNLNSITRLLFLKRTLKHQIRIPRHLHHLLLIVTINHLICRKHVLILKLSTFCCLHGSIITVISLANWWHLS